MEDESRPLKRPRVAAEDLSSSTTTSDNLQQLLEQGEWDKVVTRVRSNPQEAATSSDPSPLATACRSGAPHNCIRALLDAAPENVRRVLDARGTPLHEAVVHDVTGVDVIDALLKADEELGIDENSPTRATLLQDIDGFTPLHLLIRRRFQSHILENESGGDATTEADSGLMEILERLVASCPEAVVISDRGEYEEPPLIYAIKANIYAPLLSSEDETLARVERYIFEMVSIMLKHYPQAASRVFSGYRGQYTALHSSVFHGRFTSTIGLLLRTEAEHPSQQIPALLGNTQGEVPLHFCSMKGERPQTVALLARSSPDAVLKRDSSGLTPFHWLWIRYVGNLLALDEGGRGSDSTIELQQPNQQPPFETNRYNEFTSLEQQGDFGSDLMRMDPPVDFLRMRHIPTEVQGDSESLQGVNDTVSVLQHIRDHYAARGENETTLWNRQEVVTSLFWTKVVSLLDAAQVAGENSPRGNSVMVHTAFASPSCVPALCQVAARLFPEELSQLDGAGRLPIHYAASRQWHAWDWPRDDGLNEQAAAKLLEYESLRVLKSAIALSPRKAVRVVDNDRRLVLHHVVDTFVKASSHVVCAVSTPMEEMLKVLVDLVGRYPESLQRRDGVSMLYPFLQATALATEEKKHAHVREELPLSLTYALLRNNPTILARAS